MMLPCPFRFTRLRQSLLPQNFRAAPYPGPAGGIRRLSPHRAYKKQEVIGRFSVGRVGPVGRVGRYHAGRICARPTGPTRPTRPTTHKQNLSGLRATPALVVEGKRSVNSTELRLSEISQCEDHTKKGTPLTGRRAEDTIPGGVMCLSYSKTGVLSRRMTGNAYASFDCIY